MICLITKFRIKTIAAKDAKDLYKFFLKQSQIKSEEITSVNNDVYFSSWMVSLVDCYRFTIEKLINKRKDIAQTYNKIRQIYAEFIQEESDFNDKKATILDDVANIDMEITKLEKIIADKSSLLSNFYAGKPLPDGLTPRKLKRIKLKYEQDFDQKKAEKRSASNISSIQSEKDKNIRQYKDKIRYLEYDFSNKIDLLYRQICKIEIKYNEQLNYYCKKLCQHVNHISIEDGNQYSRIHQWNRVVTNNKSMVISIIPVNRLEDIASYCNIPLISKKELYKNERTLINMKINPAISLEYEV